MCSLEEASRLKNRTERRLRRERFGDVQGPLVISQARKYLVHLADEPGGTVEIDLFGRACAHCFRDHLEIAFNRDPRLVLATFDEHGRVEVYHRDCFFRASAVEAEQVVLTNRPSINLRDQSLMVDKTWFARPKRKEARTSVRQLALICLARTI